MENYIIWNQFAHDGLVEQIRSVTRENKDKFVPTTVSTGVPGYRKSQVLWHYNYMELYQAFTDRMRQVMPIISQRFELPDQYDLELQLTISGDGDYFKRHQDNGTPDTQLRVLTYVYYFCMTDTPVPPFSGGELVIEPPEGVVTIDPRHNSLVVFRSEYWHEVMPVSVPYKIWSDSRCTLNGWVRRTI